MSVLVIENARRDQKKTFPESSLIIYVDSLPGRVSLLDALREMAEEEKEMKRSSS